jgi:hypothetical protein
VRKVEFASTPIVVMTSFFALMQCVFASER